MNPATEPPSSLRKGMSSAASVTTLNTYRTGAGKDVLGGALDVEAHYDKRNAQFVSRFESIELRVIIDNYRRLNPNDAFWNNFDPDTCTWHHVHEELTKAEDEYRRKGVGNFLRRAFRNDGLTRNLVPLLEGIPDSDGLGFLKGGLIIVFNAVKRRAQACVKIFACFRQVPDILRGAHEALQRFPGSQDLYACWSRLHEELSSCLPRLIAMLLRHSDQHKIKQYARSLFGNEIADVDRIVQLITTAQNALSLQVGRLSDRQDDRVAEQVDQIHSGTSSMLVQMGQMNETNKTYAAFIQAENVRLHAENTALRQKASSQDVLNCAHQIFEEILRNRDFNEVMQRLENSKPHSGTPSYEPATYDLDELIMILCDDSEASCHVNDLYASLQKYETFSDKELAQAAHLSQTNQFRQWLQGLRSDRLLVDGHCTRARTSPMSIFCASLIQSLLERSTKQTSHHSTSLVLYFFCGYHMYNDGPLEGPQGLIRSLTTQLILAWPQQTRPPDLRYISSLLPGMVSSAQEDLEIETICSIFEALLKQLPASSTVHCIVDGLSYFETSLGNWSEDICGVVEFLYRCSSSNMDTGLRATFKVLLASADKSSVVCDLPALPRDRMVNLRAGSFYNSLLSPRAFVSSLQIPAVYSDQFQSEDELDGEYASDGY